MEISIIVPVYNTEKYIVRCLESISNQTFQDYEVIIIDDKGQDNAMAIAEKFARKDARIRIIHHNENKGTMVARRTGYTNANGKYIMFLDSDDTFPPDSLELLHKSITAQHCDIVIGGFTYVFDNGDKALHLPKITVPLTPKELYYKLLSHEATHNLAFSIFNKSLFDNTFITYPNQTNGEDLIQFYQLVGYSSKIGFCNNSIYNYYQNNDSSTHAKVDANKIRQFIIAHNFKISYLSNFNIKTSAILKNIVPIISDYYCHDASKKQLYSINPIIADAMSPLKAIHYMSIKQWIKYILRYFKILRY